MKRVALAWLCLLLSVAQVSLLQSAAMADPSEASGASSSRVAVRAAIRSRKLVSEAAAEPASSVAEASEDKKEYPAAEAPGAAEAGGAAAAEVTKHRSSDKSVAGGGVIIGGLVTAIFAAVFCYIRVTRKKDGAAH
ncbi:hypothetical protein BT93_A1441 [Corymbia citriodora subsp. variegata]|nr:hypothetical protein BT93_A1441 [Corymbia citriodora subsp. variegata]